MVLSKRERWILIGSAAAVSVLVLDYMVWSPWRDNQDALDRQRAKLTKELTQSRLLIGQEPAMSAKWRQMVQDGLKTDPGDAESQITRSVGEWMAKAGVAQTLMKPDRLTEKSRLPQISFQVAGTGTMLSIKRLLYQLQTASIPVRVTEVQINARKEGTDDMNLQLRLSTVYQGKRPTTASASPPAGKTEGE